MTVGGERSNSSLGIVIQSAYAFSKYYANGMGFAS
jgi:hypothetical protein